MTPNEKAIAFVRAWKCMGPGEGLKTCDADRGGDFCAPCRELIRKLEVLLLLERAEALKLARDVESEHVCASHDCHADEVTNAIKGWANV